MKNVKLFLATIILTAFSGVAIAAGNLNVNVVPLSIDNILVKVSNIEKSRYEIELTNQKGVIVYYKRTSSPSSTYTKQYDFSRLADGDYKLTVRVGSEKMENNLRIDRGDVKLVNQRKEIEPFFTMKDNRLEISYLNFAKEDIIIYVYDKNNLLYEKKIEPQFAINYAIDFSKLQSGEYNTILASENSSFNYTVNLK